MKKIFKLFYLRFRKYLLHFLSAFLFQQNGRPITIPGDLKKALFIRIDRIGDIVLSTPALKAFKISYPDCELTVIATKSNKPVLVNLPYVDKIITIDRNQKFIEKVYILKQLSKDNYDIAIDPYSDFELKTALIAAWSGATLKLGYGSYGREVFFNVISKMPGNNTHFKDVVLNVLKPIGVKKIFSTPEIRLSETEKEWPLIWAKENKVGSKPIVGIHPGAHYESQRWLPEYFADLINKINDQKKFSAILFLGSEDFSLAKTIKAMIKKNIPTFISNDLRKFLALQSLCKVFICNNSGPLHLAAAQKIQTISFMGPTKKERWMPIGIAHKVLRIDTLPCIGCQAGSCKFETHDCMRLIVPSIVIDALNSCCLQEI